MEKTNTTLKERLGEALKISGKQKSEIARECGETRQSVNSWFLTGRISKEKLPQLANVLNVDLVKLLSGDLPPDSYNVSREKLNLVPVIGRGMGGLPDTMFTDEGRPTNGHDEFAEVYSGDQAAFVTSVVENSMYPKYVHGDYALVEPNTTPELEDDVLIKTVKGEVMLKRLLSRRGGIVLGSYNEQKTYTFQEDEIRWMYYVAYPVPRRKIKNRV